MLSSLEKHGICIQKLTAFIIWRECNFSKKQLQTAAGLANFRIYTNSHQNKHRHKKHRTAKFTLLVLNKKRCPSSGHTHYSRTYHECRLYVTSCRSKENKYWSCLTMITTQMFLSLTSIVKDFVEMNYPNAWTLILTNNTSNSLRALSCGYECVHMHKNTKYWRITITANHKTVEITCKQASWQHTRNTYTCISTFRQPHVTANKVSFPIGSTFKLSKQLRNKSKQIYL